MIDNSLGNEGNLEYEVCCTFQEYDDKLDVDHVANDGKKMDEDDNGDDNVEVDVDVVTDDIDVVGDSDAGKMDDRDIESGNDNKDDDNEDRILCCRCIVFNIFFLLFFALLVFLFFIFFDISRSSQHFF